MSWHRDPRNDEEWQEAADAAEASLVLVSARQYGLVSGGPQVNAGRCAGILKRARERGIEPRPWTGQDVR